MSTNTEKLPRKFPPPCWNHDEALVLIDAYRERWYALRRGYLRTADWDSVAAAVALRFPDASPAKTSAQCRHKMEKLRQRYRAEKQRSLSYPGRFLSSWFFFDSMDAMENGSSTTVGSNQETGDRVDSGNGSRAKAVIDQKLIPSSKNSKKIDGNSNPNLGFDHEGVDQGGGFRVKAVGDRNSVPLGFRAKNSSKNDGKSIPNFGNRASNGYSQYLDFGSDDDVDGDGDFGSGFHVKTPIDEDFVPPGSKKFGKFYKTPKFASDHGGSDGVDGDRFRAKKFSKIDGKLNPNFDWDDGAYNGIDANGEVWVKIRSDRNSVPAGFRAQYSGKTGRNSNPNIDPRVMDGKTGGGGVKRGRSQVAEMVSSIKLLGEGFVKMEKMKMEMAREIEKMRMEMEMKRCELLIQSQQQIVDAFVKGFFEIKKVVKPTASPDS